MHVRLDVEPAEVVIDEGTLDNRRTLFASGHYETFTMRSVVHWDADCGGAADCNAVPTVEFTDIRGRRWRRDRDYRLTEISK